MNHFKEMSRLNSKIVKLTDQGNKLLDEVMSANSANGMITLPTLDKMERVLSLYNQTADALAALLQQHDALAAKFPSDGMNARREEIVTFLDGMHMAATGLEQMLNRANGVEQ